MPKTKPATAPILITPEQYEIVKLVTRRLRVLLNNPLIDDADAVVHVANEYLDDLHATKLKPLSLPPADVQSEHEGDPGEPLGLPG